MNYIIRLTNDETEPRYVLRGLGLGRYEYTDSKDAAGRYTAEKAKKFAEDIRARKGKELGGDQTLVEVIELGGEDPAEKPSEPWSVRGDIGGMKLELKPDGGRKFRYRYRDASGNMIEGADPVKMITAYCRDCAKNLIKKVQEYERS